MMQHSPKTSSTPPIVSVVVTNWNGTANLARCLSALQISARALTESSELIVVDDASSDDSAAVVRERFPAVRLLQNERNVGFARSTNRGAKAARGRVLVLANNDLLPREEFLAALIAPFLIPTRGLFAVSAKTVGWYDGKPNQVCMGAVWKGGRITPAWDDPAVQTACLFTQAGAAAYDRKKFLQLGGLSALYEPGYWEDYDLSWRAAKAGLRQLYEPRAFALHIGGGSMTKRYGADGVASMKARNHRLFEAANLTSPRLLAEWTARLPLALARDVAKGSLLGGDFFAAMAVFPRFQEAVRRRLSLPRFRTDEEVLAPFRHFTPSF